MIKVLLMNQWKIFLNTMKSQRNSNYISYVVSFLVIGALLYFLTKGVWNVSDSITESVLAGILSYGFLIVVGLIVLLGTPQVFKHLYAATDLGLLFTLPIPTKNIFWIKYIQSFVGVPFFCFLFFVIPLVTYGVVTGANILFYPVLILVLLAIIIIGLSIAYLFNLVLIQFVPASKANEFMTVMSMLAGLFGYLMYMIPNLASEGSLMENLLSGLPLFPKWMPVTWGSEALVHAMNGSFDFLIPIALLLVLAIFSVMLTASLVEKGFRTGWIRLSEGGGRKKKKSTIKKAGHKLHHPVIAIAKKEGYAIKRDMREWLIFLPLAFFVIFPLFGLFSSGAKLSEIREFNEVSWPIAQAALLFIYALLNGQVAASSISREGTSIWILRTLPLSGKDIARGKLLISWLIPLTLLTVFECIVGIILGWTLLQFVIGIAVKAFITVGISAIGIWLGTIGAKYNPVNPQQRLKFGTAILLMVFSYVYLFLALIPYVILLVPTEAIEFASDINASGFWGMLASIFLTLLTWKASYPTLMVMFGIVVMLLFSIGIAAIFMSISARKIDKGIKIDIVNESSSGSRFKNKKAGGSLY